MRQRHSTLSSESFQVLHLTISETRRWWVSKNTHIQSFCLLYICFMIFVGLCFSWSLYFQSFYWNIVDQHYCVSFRCSTRGGFPIAQTVKYLPAMQETRVRSLDWEVPLAKGIVIYASILAWRIPWTEKPGGLQSVGSHRVRHDWGANAHTHSDVTFVHIVKWAL